jgi:hypothetical protein
VEERVWQVAVADGLGYFRVLAQIFSLVEFLIKRNVYWGSKGLGLREHHSFPPTAGWPLLHGLLFEYESLGHQRTSSNEEMPSG